MLAVCIVSELSFFQLTEPYLSRCRISGQRIRTLRPHPSASYWHRSFVAPSFTPLQLAHLVECFVHRKAGDLQTLPWLFPFTGQVCRRTCIRARANYLGEASINRFISKPTSQGRWRAKGLQQKSTRRKFFFAAVGTYSHATWQSITAKPWPLLSDRKFGTSTPPRRSRSRTFTRRHVASLQRRRQRLRLALRHLPPKALRRPLLRHLPLRRFKPNFNEGYLSTVQ